MTVHPHFDGPGKASASRAGATAGYALVTALSAALDKAADALAEKQSHKAIHQVRKALKEYRALLRLVPGDAPKAERKAAAATARSMSAARDQQAALDALSALCDAKVLKQEAADRTGAVIRGLPSPNEAVDPAESVRKFLKRARSSMSGAVGDAALEADVIASLAKAYKRARKVTDWGHAEGLHDLRKDVVIHRYQMAFLATLGGPGKRRGKKAQRLRDTLGTSQDLEAMKRILREAASDRDAELLGEVTAASRQLQHRLLKKARSRHAALFHRKPETFAKRIAKPVLEAKRSALKQLH